MHFKNNKLLFIVLSTYLLLTGLLADPELPLTEKQLQSLADDVCGDMFFQPVSRNIIPLLITLIYVIK